jgi:NADH-quinone oxidoreductase subunit D
MMTSYFRVGGLAYDLPDEFVPTVAAFLEIMPGRVDEYESLLTGNPVWLERTVGVGAIDTEAAIP